VITRNQRLVVRDDLSWSRRVVQNLQFNLVTEQTTILVLVRGPQVVALLKGLPVAEKSPVKESDAPINTGWPLAMVPLDDAHSWWRQQLVTPVRLKPHRTREKVANSLSYILPLHLRGPGIPNVRYSRVDHPMGDAVTITMTRPSHKVAEPFKG